MIERIDLCLEYALKTTLFARPYSTQHSGWHPYTGRIVIDPAILAGKPVIKGTRIPVELVLERLEEDVNTTLLFADYPQLTLEDIQACLWYAKELVRGEEVYPVGTDHPTHQQSSV